MQRLKAALTRQGAAALLRVSERTVRNWEKGRTVIPYTAYKLLCIEAGYQLPGEAWRGFLLRGDTIWSPEGKSFTAYDLAWWQLTCELARDRLARALQPAAAATQPVAEAMPVPLRAADRRDATAQPIQSEYPSLQNRSLSAAQMQAAGRAAGAPAAAAAEAAPACASLIEPVLVVPADAVPVPNRVADRCNAIVLPIPSEGQRLSNTCRFVSN